ncbi:hypothetical protein ACTGJ9_022905 [Bradyrhizobium sp. RDM12]
MSDVGSAPRDPRLAGAADTLERAMLEASPAQQAATCEAREALGASSAD